MSSTPTLIGMPEPQSNVDTPTDAPGTPNSTTTSLSALSTTAIKDGHRGSAHPTASSHHQHTLSSNTLEAQRADRISRLAGLERVTTATPQNPSGNTSVPATGQIPGYFDQAGNPVYTTRMSTVGSASATGSLTGRTTTWASNSTKGQTEADDDEMSMDNNFREIDDRDRFSASAMDEEGNEDGMSDDTSLVGFGEGAGSTVSGPIYSRSNVLASPLAVGKSGLAKEVSSSSPGTPISASTSTTTEQQKRDARMLDGITDDNTSGYVDTAARGQGVGIAGNRHSSGSGLGTGVGVEAAEKILKERIDDSPSAASRPPLGSPDQAGLGKFYFEEKK
ncbi:hypothetical protein BOTCAL_0045g00100 [Botryotinia calthae]|uniref:Uncharacterized protein n=1 Tax=Botryotinia calthae TaxID=38488 RepID=A0A4Y8DBG7_9HELO|nr:hypothetical protein BOTCAL_0045g00100 [Botryotinia calthae]